jgi:hypothetical protein
MLAMVGLAASGSRMTWQVSSPQGSAGALIVGHGSLLEQMWASQ